MNAHKHCDLKIPVRLEDARALWADLPDSKRLEVLKSVIWTATDMHGFYQKARKLINSQAFQDTLD